MKKITVLAVIMISFFSFKGGAQIRLGLEFNIGEQQPAWGPAGYQRADYYYLPDIDAYYDVFNRQFIYLEGTNWVFRTSLPSRYRSYDLYKGYKVVINEPRPYMHAAYYRSNYSGYRNWEGRRQTAIRDYRDRRKGGWDNSRAAGHRKRY